jgi:flagellin
MRDLSVQASNSGGLNDDAKGNIQSEITQLKSELDRIANTTTFNGKKLLDGSFQENFQVGANAGETIAVNIGTAMGSAGLNVDGVDVTAAGAYTWNAAVGAPGAGEAGISQAADATTEAVLTITPTATEDWTATGTKADFEALTGTVSFGGKSFDLGSVQYDEVEDTDGSGTADGADLLMQLNKAAASALGLTYDSTTAANNLFVENAGALDFSVKEAVAGYTDADGSALDDGTNSTAQQVAAATATFSAASGASVAIDAIDDAIKTVSTQRADLGAIQNRFDHTINNLNVAVENLTASESRIRDADMAQEMVQFTRNQILSQAGTSMLAQANQSSQGVLSLLR